MSRTEINKSGLFGFALVLSLGIAGGEIALPGQSHAEHKEKHQAKPGKKEEKGKRLGASVSKEAKTKESGKEFGKEVSERARATASQTKNSGFAGRLQKRPGMSPGFF